jgi:molecular chaperone DnaK
MSRETVGYGIDLGTTNSAIALCGGDRADPFRNNEGEEYTPSAVQIDETGSLIVGRAAKESIEYDLRNAFVEFKLQMGTDHTYTFRRSKRVMRPQDLSAEVLKSLLADVKQANDEDVEAAVVTVPAVFELPQCKATREAAEAAGLAYSPLLMEPVAAGFAYGFQGEDEKAHWLVYDLGGGTFDAAIIRVSDGAIQVPNHLGDNHLGGKLIDWAIVEELLVPHLAAQYRLPDFHRGNEKWASACAKLKLFVEKAKIRCSRAASARITIDYLCDDDRGTKVQCTYDLRQEEVARLAAPFLDRSVRLCREVLAEKGLGPADIEKLLLVGGPTLAPYVRERLADKREGLGIPLQFSIDPLTVVARGAALFAGGLRIERKPGTRKVEAGQLEIALEYQPAGVEPEPPVGGQVLAPGRDLASYTIEFVNAEVVPPWRSGKVGLSPEGKFVVTLWAEKGRVNRFAIELADGTGRKVSTVPDAIPYEVRQLEAAMAGQPLVQSVGITLQGNSVRRYVEKGRTLPVRHRGVHHTTQLAKRGDSNPVIRIPVVEGDYTRADRNVSIGELLILGTQIKRDVPPNSEVEVVIEIDASRQVTTRAYIPYIDEEFERVIDLVKRHADPAELEKCLASEIERLAKLRERVENTGDMRARQILQQIDADRMVHEVEAALRASQGDPDALDKCPKRLVAFQLQLDALEEALSWPALVAEMEQQIDFTRDIMQAFGSAADRQVASALESEQRAAERGRDSDLLRRKVEEARSHRFSVWKRHDDYWVAYFRALERDLADMTDQGAARQLVAQGQRAINDGSRAALEAACQQLSALLPRDVTPQGVGGLLR